MKKFHIKLTALLVMAAMLFSLSACNARRSTKDSDDDDAVSGALPNTATAARRIHLFRRSLQMRLILMSLRLPSPMDLMITLRHQTI